MVTKPFQWRIYGACYDMEVAGGLLWEFADFYKNASHSIPTIPTRNYIFEINSSCSNTDHTSLVKNMLSDIMPPWGF